MLNRSVFLVVSKNGVWVRESEQAAFVFVQENGGTGYEVYEVTAVKECGSVHAFLRRTLLAKRDQIDAELAELGS